MPSKRRSNAQGRAKQPQRANNRQAPATLDPTTNDIVGVALVALAAAMTVALLVATPAPVTQTVGEYLRLLFGQGSLLVPLAIMMFALTFFLDNYGPISMRIAAGLAMMVLAILSLMSITYVGAEDAPNLVLTGDVVLARGGYVGGGIAWALLSSVGFGVGVVVLVLLLVVGAIICGFSISGFVAKLRRQARDTAGQVQASRARRAQERQARRAERRLVRQRRASARAEAAAAGYDEWQPYEDSPADEGVQPMVPATSYLGTRKTSVLRRGEPDLGGGEVKQEEGGFGDVLTRTLSALPTRVLARRKQETSPAPEAADAPDFDDAPWDDVAADEDFYESYAREEDSESGISKRPLHQSIPSASSNSSASQSLAVSSGHQVTIPDFLRAQAAAANGISSWEDEEEDEDVSATPTKKSRRSKATSSKKGSANKASTQMRTSTESAQTNEDEEPGYVLPSFDILTKNPHKAASAASDSELNSTMRRLQSTLQEFGLKARVVEYVAGPLVTTFQIEMGEGERVNRITNLEDDIALSLAAESVRIFAPIPGTSRVGIEIPNKKSETVRLGDVLPYARGGALEFAVGRDAGGKAVIADLAKMPHLLVAGATGSGKSVMINTLIMSILMRDTPKDVRLILVDPKRVEFSAYNGLPHLYVPVVTEPRQAASALAWAVSEMERRLKVFERAGARNIGVYNEMCVSGKLSEMDNPPEPMPFLVIIIDELSDLMMVAGKDVEASIVRIAQLARAAGIHLVLATQRPSADVVTGLIKSNIETRIALSVASSLDSRVILDQTGADRLLGNGDMLFKFRGRRTRRVLGCFVEDREINMVVEHWQAQGTPDYHEEILTQIPQATGGGSASSADGDQDDPLVWEAAQIVVESQLGSTSGLQRRLKVGYARAGRIMDMLEAKGVVGPPDGSKPREVLLDEEGLEDLRAAEAKFKEV